MGFCACWMKMDILCKEFGKLVLLNALDFLSKIAYNLNYSI